MSSTPRMLGGRYEVGELIGRGGMAEVHKGHDTRMGRPVAIKILRSDHARDSSFLHRFRREAQSVAGLNHRSIVAVYDSGEDRVTESGGATLSIPYIVMEYVDGRTLREVLNEDGVMGPREAAHAVEGVLDALAYSHEMGIVHRDIKPGNVMISGTGQVKVMDFGIARAVADTQATMTQTHAVIGTAQYISPEQARGETVDNRSDIYSAGCLLFELLTGRTPFTGEPIALTYQHVNAEVPLPRTLDADVPEDLDAIVLHALTKDRDERYQDAADMADDLRAFQARRPISPAAAAALGAGALGVAGAAGAAAADPAPTEVYAPAGATVAPGPAPTESDTSTYPAVQEERRRGGGLGWLLAALLLIPLALLGWYAWTESQDQPPATTMVSVPQLVGLDADVADSELRKVGLVGDPSEVSSEKPAGEVVGQEPGQGTRVPEGDTVAYQVSTGPEQASVPDLIGKTRKEAEAELKAAGLTLGEVTEEDSPDQEKGKVLSSTPASGETVEKGSSVSISIASGMIQIDDYVGQNVNDVGFTLRQMGLKVKEVKEQSDKPEDEILAQEPGAGKIKQGGTVTLTVAVPKPETITTTTTSEPTTSSSPMTEDPPPSDTTGPPNPTGTESPSAGGGPRRDNANPRPTG